MPVDYVWISSPRQIYHLEQESWNIGFFLFYCFATRLLLLGGIDRKQNKTIKVVIYTKVVKHV